MLNQFFEDTLALVIAQAVTAMVLAIGIIWVARKRDIHLEREMIIALARGLVQIVIIGSVLLAILRGDILLGVLVLLVMVVIASSITARRVRGIPGAFQVSLYGIGLGAGLVTLVMTWLGVIDIALTSLIPVGSMLIANAMNTNSPVLDRFRTEVEANTGQIDAGLSLGASPKAVINPYVQAAVHASLIPRLDSLRSLGIVWIPELMAGMILAGADPLYAAVYQFVVIAMIFAVSGLTSVISTLLIRNQIFSSAEQLILRPGEE